MKSLPVLIVAAVLAVQFSDCIPVKSEEFAEQLRQIVHDVYPDSLRSERAIENGNDDRFCDDTPCGWTSFNPVTRRSKTFMSNTCKCPDETYKCVRTTENVSMSAYVYYCRQNTTVEDDTRE